jgi:hypothetical protein
MPAGSIEHSRYFAHPPMPKHVVNEALGNVHLKDTGSCQCLMQWEEDSGLLTGCVAPICADGDKKRIFRSCCERGWRESGGRRLVIVGFAKT